MVDFRGDVRGLGEGSVTGDGREIAEFYLECHGQALLVQAAQLAAYAFGLGQEAARELLPVQGVTFQRVLGTARLRFRVRYHGRFVDAAGPIVEECAASAHAFFPELPGTCQDVLCRGDVEGGQFCRHAPADARDLVHRQVLQKIPDVFGPDDRQAVGFVPVRGDLGQEFVRGDAHRAGQARFVKDGRLEPCGQIFRGAEETRRAAHVRVSLIHGGLFHHRTQVAHYSHDTCRDFAVARHATGQIHRVGAEPASLDDGHGRPDSVSPGLVGSCRGHAAKRLPDDHGLAFELGIVGLLYRGEEGVHIQVKDGPGWRGGLRAGFFHGGDCLSGCRPGQGGHGMKEVIFLGCFDNIMQKP